MEWHLNSYALTLFVCAVATIWVAAHAWRQRASVGVSPALALLGITIWSLGYAVALGVYDLSGRIFWAKAQHLGIALASVAVATFAMQYSGHARWLTRRNILLLTAVPFIGMLLAWSNEAHHLIWANMQLRIEGSLALLDISYGPYFWFYAAYNYLVLLTSAGIFLRAALRSPYLQKQQATILLIGVLFPSVLILVYLAGLSPFPNLDLAPLGWSVCGLIIAWGLFRYRLFDLVPVARDALIENMRDAVLELDPQNRIVGINLAAQQIIGTTAQAAVGQRAGVILSAWQDLGKEYRDVIEIETEIAIGQERPCHFEWRIYPLLDQQKNVNGRLIILHDIARRKRAEQESKQRLNELATINAISQSSAAQLELSKLLELVGEKLLQVFDVNGVYISLHNRDTNMLHFPYWKSQGVLFQVNPISLRGGFVSEIVKSRQPLLINQDYERRFGELGGIHVTSPTGKHPQAWLGVPMLAGDEAIGVISVQDFDRENVFTDDDVRLLTTIAANVGIAIRNAQLYMAAQQELTERKQIEAELRRANERLQTQLKEIELLQDKLNEQAIRDSLTDLFNRRYMEETLERELARATRDHSPLSIVMMDIDHFKIVNDTCGHKPGDLFLRQLADLLHAQTRQMDVACRYGGEEFVVIMPGAQTDAASRRAEQWRKAVESLQVDDTRHALRITLSLGVSTFPTHGKTSDELLRAADDALYATKNAGRNCVIVWNGESK